MDDAVSLMPLMVSVVCIWFGQFVVLVSRVVQLRGLNQMDLSP
jgi:hypothetical protein